MSLITGYNNISTHNNIFFIISLIILSIGILFLIIGYGIYPQSQSLNHISSNDGLITFQK